MELQTYLNNAVAGIRKETFDKSDQLTLGEIISKIEAIMLDGKTPDVVFDFEYAYPSGIDSWRGSYSELALEFGIEHGDLQPMKIIEFHKMLKETVGKTLTGYKGGEFVMTRHTPVWVANYGNSGNTAVIEVVDKGWEVILMTGYGEF